MIAPNLDSARQQRTAPMTLLGAIIGFLIVAALAFIWLQVPVGEFRDLLAYLAISAVVSAGFGFLMYRLAESGRRTIRTKILMTYGVGIAIVILNILVTAQLMFISSHDLGLLILLMIFGAVFSISFGASMTGRMSRIVRDLADSARRVSGGDLDARVPVTTNDELGELAHSFNVMVANVNESEDRRRRAEAARRELVAAVSHDLRTPLTSIQAMLEALNDGVVEDPRTVRRYLQTMSGQIAHLNRLIDDLFELSQLDAASQPYEYWRNDLSALVCETVEGVAMTARERNVVVEACCDGPLMVDIEATKIARAVSNLVDNAVRHAPDGSIVRVMVERGSDAAIVRVMDEGVGISAEDLPYLFERFYRGEKSRSRSHGGAGLGLAISKGIVEAHGGQIWAANRPEHGAEFVFTLPLVERSTAAV